MIRSKLKDQLIHLYKKKIMKYFYIWQQNDNKKTKVTKKKHIEAMEIQSCSLVQEVLVAQRDVQKQA
jgi:hypothetical protein